MNGSATARGAGAAKEKPNMARTARVPGNRAGLAGTQLLGRFKVTVVRLVDTQLQHVRESLLSELECEARTSSRGERPSELVRLDHDKPSTPPPAIDNASDAPVLGQLDEQRAASKTLSYPECTVGTCRCRPEFFCFTQDTLGTAPAPGKQCNFNGTDCSCLSATARGGG
jgi:hypothetical protein